jgi:molybdenum cofactor synthesis domain-containing protein
LTRTIGARPRAVIVVTGSELVRGERTDLNGPFLAREALSLGLDPARILFVGDRPGDLAAALEDALRADLCLVSGGLGPTHDDRTVEVLAGITGRQLSVDPTLEAEIGEISRTFAARLRRPYADFEAGVRKQASLPDGALSLGLAGTAPGLVLEHRGCVVVVLPGPPRELQRLWSSALASEPVRRVLARTTPPGRRVLRFFGASESAVAQALAEAGGDGNGVEATICARDFEIHVDVVVDEGAEARAEQLS